jgi:hypothetical protein
MNEGTRSGKSTIPFVGLSDPQTDFTFYLLPPLSLHAFMASVGPTSPSTGWTVRGSNSGGGEISHTRSDRPWRPPILLYNGYRILPGIKRPGRGVDHLPHLAPRLKKE